MKKIWEYLRSSLWFLPSAIVTGAIVCAFVLLELEALLPTRDFVDRWPRIFGAGADGAREVLSVIAGSVITVVGVSFSITIVVLALASSQYSPRVLRNFMRDWHTQGVLGGLLGIFAYCLVVLRTVRSEDNEGFVPALAILGSLVLAFVGIGLLIFFIHHIASSIQATNIARSVFEETKKTIDLVFPNKRGQKSLLVENGVSNIDQLSEWYSVESQETGYLSCVTLHQLIHCAKSHQTLIKMEKAVGEFVTEGSILASTKNRIDENEMKKIRSAFDIGYGRTLEQDVSYGIRQLVDVALKGLSPGINDTTTALICVDYLGAILTRLADRELYPDQLSSEKELPLIWRGPTFQIFVTHSFTQIRQNGAKNPAVLSRLLRTLMMVTLKIRDKDRLQTLDDQVELIRKVASSHINSQDRGEIEEAFAKWHNIKNKIQKELI